MKLSFPLMSTLRPRKFPVTLRDGTKLIWSSQLMKTQKRFESSKKPEEEIDWTVDEETWKKCFDQQLTLLNEINQCGVFKGWIKGNEWFALDSDKMIKSTSAEEGKKLLDNKLGRIVRNEKVNGHTVSTMFLSIDHRFGGVLGDRPILFETMVFGYSKGLFNTTYALYQERCCTWDEAIAMHKRVCDQIHNGTLKQVLDFEERQRYYYSDESLRDLAKMFRDEAEQKEKEKK